MNTTHATILATSVLLIVVSLVAALVAGTMAGCNQRPSQAADAQAAPDANAAHARATFVGRIYDPAGELRPPQALPKVVRSDDEWKTRLASDQYRILRKHGTERAFTGALLKNKDAGIYRCAACDLPLFTSESKFESGTGWPSFSRAIAGGNVGEERDGSLGMVRTEIHCARCEGHLGHVFPDGPPPTGQRYCVNSLSIAFTPADEIASLAEANDGADMNPDLTPDLEPDLEPHMAPDMEPDAASPAALDVPTATAVFAGGCFWCVEAVFEELDGVKGAISGYAGGTADTANYAAVCSGRTRHAEAVQIVYDPKKISYEDLLRVHFATHDPTTLDRQGPDTGPQYRSAIFFADEQERALARAFIDDLTEQRVYGGRPVVTKLEPLTKFYPAEQYHQDYVCANPQQGYVRQVALPKVAKVRKQFGEMLKEQSPLDRGGR